MARSGYGWSWIFFWNDMAWLKMHDMFLVLWKMPKKKLWKKMTFYRFWTCNRGWLPSRQPEKYAKYFNVLGTCTQYLPHNTWDKNKIKKKYSRSSFLLGVNLCNIWYIVKTNFDVTELWNLNSSKKWHSISLYGLATFIDTPRNTFCFICDGFRWKYQCLFNYRSEYQEFEKKHLFLTEDI